jgi:hypothetical protein
MALPPRPAALPPGQALRYYDERMIIDITANRVIAAVSQNITSIYAADDCRELIPKIETFYRICKDLSFLQILENRTHRGQIAIGNDGYPRILNSEKPADKAKLETLLNDTNKYIYNNFKLSMKTTEAFFKDNMRSWRCNVPDFSSILHGGGDGNSKRKSIKKRRKNTRKNCKSRKCR